MVANISYQWMIYIIKSRKKKIFIVLLRQRRHITQLFRLQFIFMVRSAYLGFPVIHDGISNRLGFRHVFIAYTTQPQRLDASSRRRVLRLESCIFTLRCTKATHRWTFYSLFHKEWLRGSAPLRRLQLGSGVWGVRKACWFSHTLRRTSAP